MRRIFFGLAALSLVFVLGTGAVQSQSNEKITSYQTRIQLSQDNSATVTEQIAYDFGSNQRHGVFRDIPITYAFQDQDGQGFRADFKLISVQRDGEPESSKVSGQDIKRIRIGDPDREISGEHVYTIRYRLNPVVFKANDQDQDVFRYDAIGSGWEVPITNVSVQLDSEVTPVETACYTGKFGSGQQNCSAISRNRSALFATSETLGEGQGFTVDAGFEPGSFATYPELKPIEIKTDTTPIWQKVLPFLVPLAFLLIFAGIIYNQLRYRWLRRQELVVPQYEPPEKFTPGEVGLLADNSVDGVEFTATLIDLAVRGYIKIDEVKPPKFMGLSKGKYKVTRLDKTGGLRDYEQKLLDEVLGSKQEVVLNEVDNTSLRSALKDLKQSVVASLAERGYYQKKQSFNLKGAKGKIGIGAVIIFFALFFFAPMLLFAIGLPLGIYGAWHGGSMLAKRMTNKGYSGWAHVEGFKDFLMMTQKERIAFHEAPERNPDQFSELLPYAVALGVEKEWVKQFGDIDLSSQTGWYSSPRGVASAAFVGDLASGVNSSVSAATSSASSSGVGGGSVGGGAGGGGGGGW